MVSERVLRDGVREKGAGSVGRMGGEWSFRFNRRGDINLKLARRQP